MTDAEDLESARTMHPSVPPGSSFGKYEVIRRLGEGGMGSVYEARHGDLGRRVALKVLRSKLARNKTYLERFLREGRIAARLDHPHVVGVFDVGTESGSPYLVMEFLSGEDLDAYLSARGALDASEAVDILLPILAALDVAHRTGLVHRDLKPANIFLCRAAHGGLHPKLLDFGIAKPGSDEAAQLTGTAEVFGTPQYMAPEQVRRAKDAKAASDQYAMGVILYRAVVGKEAFELGDLSVYAVLERVVGGTFPSPRRVRPDVDMGIERVILRAMAKDPRERFPSVRAFGAALLPYASPGVRKTWTDAFSSEEATAATIPPGEVSVVVPRSATPAVSSSAPSAAQSTPEANADRSVPPGTLSAAEVATRPSMHRTSSPAVAPRRSPMLAAAGVAIGLVVCAAIYFVATRGHGEASAEPGGSGALATHDSARGADPIGEPPVIVASPSGGERLRAGGGPSAGSTIEAPTPTATAAPNSTSLATATPTATSNPTPSTTPPGSPSTNPPLPKPKSSGAVAAATTDPTAPPSPSTTKGRGKYPIE